MVISIHLTSPNVYYFEYRLGLKKPKSGDKNKLDHFDFSLVHQNIDYKEIFGVLN